MCASTNNKMLYESPDFIKKKRENNPKPAVLQLLTFLTKQMSLKFHAKFS